MKTENFKRRAFDQWKIAAPGKRLGAQLIDQGLAAALTASVLFYAYPRKTWMQEWWLAWLFLWPFVSVTAQSFFLWFLATTPGKQIFGLHLQSAQHPQGPSPYLSLWQILARTSSWWVGFFTLGIGWTPIFTRSDRRAWHDVVADTVVLHKVSEAKPLTPLEQKLGHGWAAIVSLALVCTLTATVIIQIYHLNGEIHVAVLDSTLGSNTWSGMLDDFESSPRTPNSQDKMQMSSSEILQRLKTLPSLRSQIDFLNQQAEDAQKNSAKFYAIKFLEASLLMRAGEFKKAYGIAGRIKNEEANTLSPEIRPIFKKLQVLACQNQALSECGEVPLKFCTTENFWNDWNSGCHLKNKNSFKTSGEAFGYWWSKINSGYAARDEKAWQEAKNRFQKANETSFEKDLVAAIDFTMALKNDNPQELLEKYHAINRDGIFWAWAQNHAIKEFGKQWILVVPVEDRKQIVFYSLPVEFKDRSIANVK